MSPPESDEKNASNGLAGSSPLLPDRSSGLLAGPLPNRPVRLGWIAFRRRLIVLGLIGRIWCSILGHADSLTVAFMVHSTVRGYLCLRREPTRRSLTAQCLIARRRAVESVVPLVRLCSAPPPRFELPTERAAAFDPPRATTTASIRRAMREQQGPRKCVLRSRHAIEDPSGRHQRVAAQCRPGASHCLGTGGRWHRAVRWDRAQL